MNLGSQFVAAGLPCLLVQCWLAGNVVLVPPCAATSLPAVCAWFATSLATVLPAHVVVLACRLFCLCLLVVNCSARFWLRLFLLVVQRSPACRLPTRFNAPSMKTRLPRAGFLGIFLPNKYPPLDHQQQSRQADRNFKASGNCPAVSKSLILISATTVLTSQLKRPLTAPLYLPTVLSSKRFLLSWTRSLLAGAWILCAMGRLHCGSKI